MTATRREKQREATKDEIKAIARQQMAEQGTAAISLRGIAQKMQVTPTALYRYFASYDDLITELIVDAYNAHADALEAADATHPSEDYAGRLYTVLMAFREWALQHPSDFQLIYGNPIPGYHAPDEPTIAAAQRNMGAVVKVLNDAHQAGKLHLLPEYSQIPETIVAQIAYANRYGVPDVLVYIGTVGWSRIHGILMLEIFNHIQPVVGDTAAFYHHEVVEMMRSFGLSFTP